mgnify:CR=1 FL=1
MIELRDTKAEVGQSNWWLAVFMRHRLAWSILLAGWVRRQLGFVSLSHRVLRFHCVCDSWSFFLFVHYLYLFSYQPQFTYHLRNYGCSGRAKSFPVSEQINRSSINFHQFTGKRCIIYFIVFWNDLLADCYFQLQIMTLSTEQLS